ncbi:hypothetical protein BJ742DRAFT_101908 [Cladochytrium replicatum]|nr:hypothetical protein BJ742DRAFT_101908 [Cladochytrium replicatum]
MRFACVLTVVLCLAVLAFLGFNRNEDLHIPQIPLPSFLPQDKFLHLFGFATLSLCTYFVWDLSLVKSTLLTAGAVGTLAIFTEFVQGLLPYRSFDSSDIVANLIGTACGLSIALICEAARAVLSTLMASILRRQRPSTVDYIPLNRRPEGSHDDQDMV